jgi:hypothetical protein
LLKYQEVGTAGQQWQGNSVSLSSDGRVMVQGAHWDNSGRGGPFSFALLFVLPLAMRRMTRAW